MAFLPLVLSVKAKNWRMFDADSENADVEFEATRKKALGRDQYTCRFCGFKAQKFQEVHHFNDDHQDNRLENLVTACMFCHMCQHFGLAGRNDEGVLIWLPEISQDRLHHIVRSILVAKREAETATASRGMKEAAQASVKEMAEAADAMFAKLKSRMAGAEARIGTADPRELANIMLSMPDDAYAKRAEFLHGIRLLPLGVRLKERENIMPKIVDSWRDAGGLYANMKPQSWLGLVRNYLK